MHRPHEFLKNGTSAGWAAPTILLLLHASLKAPLVVEMQALQYRQPLLPLRRVLHTQSVKTDHTLRRQIRAAQLRHEARELPAPSLLTAHTDGRG